MVPSVVYGGGLGTGQSPNKKAQKFQVEYEAAALSFLNYINSSDDIRSRSTDRNNTTALFVEWASSNPLLLPIGKASSRCFQVLTLLKKMKLLKTKRHGDVVVCIFALSDTPGDYPSTEEQKSEREEVLEKRKILQKDKAGVVIVRTDEYATDSSAERKLVPPKEDVELQFDICNEGIRNNNTIRHLSNVSVTGQHKQLFDPTPAVFPISIEIRSTSTIKINFRPPGTGIYRAVVVFQFDGFKIVRYITVRSGDAAVDAVLQPTSPYKKKKSEVHMPQDMVAAPKRQGSSAAAKPFITDLPHSRIPYEVKAMIEESQLDDFLDGMDKASIEDYSSFWQHLLWASEFQAKRDITLFDMKDAELVQSGRSFVLKVPGLAEGRPSVLRGDIVLIKCAGRGWQGRVQTTRLEEVLLEFDRKFRYRKGIDKVDVRFTFSRTTFRTSHEGSKRAPRTMGPSILFPGVMDATALTGGRRVGPQLAFANRDLNPQQEAAVVNVVKGLARPLPYIIYGPPGTGKTTTVVEAIYQLAKHKEEPRILLVAPSNDAADILVEKLSACFPPSEMRRLLAMSRPIELVSETARPYAKEGLTGDKLLFEIESARIIVATVNMAARLYFNGVERGYFDVICVDEAGHATEPEVIAVASTLLDFNPRSGGQLILAGDPEQLGPIIPSTICEKNGMCVSFMERLSRRDVYLRSENGEYRAELLTKLVRNYRSHQSIIKLPNEMFYDGDLQVCGDPFKTNSMCQWEHLPVKKFPVVFHAVSGENLREANSPSWFNPQEASEVVNYVSLLTEQSTPAVDPADIGIITPYARQAQKIRLALKSRGLAAIKVGSVEIFQGQERRVIIISTVRAENDYLEHDKRFNLGFVSNKKRFNVAITRAAALLIVIGSPRVLASDKDHWRPLLKMCKENKSWVGEDWDPEENVDKEDDDDLLANVKQEEESGDNDEDWITDGMESLTISKAIEEEGIGYIHREE